MADRGRKRALLALVDARFCRRPRSRVDERSEHVRVASGRWTVLQETSRHAEALTPA